MRTPLFNGEAKSNLKCACLLATVDRFRPVLLELGMPKDILARPQPFKELASGYVDYSAWSGDARLAEQPERLFKAVSSEYGETTAKGFLEWIERHCLRPAEPVFTLWGSFFLGLAQCTSEQIAAKFSQLSVSGNTELIDAIVAFFGREAVDNNWRRLDSIEQVPHDGYENEMTIIKGFEERIDLLLVATSALRIESAYQLIGRLHNRLRPNDWATFLRGCIDLADESGLSDQDIQWTNSVFQTGGVTGSSST